ncbi:hypothetical protein CFBP5507_17845 [Agrobacterium salinitolerans]|uniref:Uncharacterized protein n=1 Tax=Agrobacterium salinitolerans TaxID=1183413 RepID=A0A4Z1QLY7_9HYPH|nr:hypothetical protein [Agrobacterium salinitolerans]UYZ09551.1 hypothetical protein CFBP5507_17845 [Agrobacterium salinitolerans]
MSVTTLIASIAKPPMEVSRDKIDAAYVDPPMDQMHPLPNGSNSEPAPLFGAGQWLNASVLAGPPVVLFFHAAPVDGDVMDRMHSPQTHREDR